MKPLPFQRLLNGNRYRATEDGYTLQSGDRRIDIPAASVDQNRGAQRLIASQPFDDLFAKAAPVSDANPDHRVLPLAA